ncbi:MAG TPA: hypothetical protein VNA21_07625 [Steroidobacteraceae bacterium]|nr:hypothetical protein [Steroidobacteraceae bacterium]
MLAGPPVHIADDSSIFADNSSIHAWACDGSLKNPWISGELRAFDKHALRAAPLRQKNVMSARQEQPSKSEASEQRQRELGDEHAYGFEEDPATKDKIDNRQVVSRRGDDGAFHVGAGPTPAGTPVKRGSE